MSDKSVWKCEKGQVKTSKILFNDMFLENMDELKYAGLTGATEVKFENSIQRTTAVANPDRSNVW